MVLVCSSAVPQITQYANSGGVRLEQMFPWKVDFGDVLYLQIGDFSAKMIPNPNP